MICLRLGSLTFPMCEKSEEAILQQVRCSAVPGGEQEDQIDNQFMDAEPVTLLFVRDQIGEQIVEWNCSALFNELLKVAHE